MVGLLRGTITALATPFTRDGMVDEAAYASFVDWQLSEGIDGLVPIGSTGEAVTLTAAERERLVRICVERASSRVPVIAGAGSNDTAAAIEASRALARAGATHLLHVSPMYNKPPQRGLLAHFRAIADASPVPIVVYNVPGRTGSNVLPETTLALAEHPNICAVKEASGDIAQIDEIIRGRPEGFAVLSGDDGITLAVMASGGEGVISVISNVAPKACVALTTAARDGDMITARALHHRLAPLVEAAFVESNPIPIKAALAMMGRMNNILRLPLVQLDPRHESMLRSVLVSSGLEL